MTLETIKQAISELPPAEKDALAAWLNEQGASPKPHAGNGAAEKPQIWGRMKGTIEICGDIISPIDERWEADE